VVPPLPLHASFGSAQELMWKGMLSLLKSLRKGGKKTFSVERKKAHANRV
jgi:hypothetical protein